MLGPRLTHCASARPDDARAVVGHVGDDPPLPMAGTLPIGKDQASVLRSIQAAFSWKARRPDRRSMVG